jgi:hypothetical protein
VLQTGNSAILSRVRLQNRSVVRDLELCNRRAKLLSIQGSEFWPKWSGPGYPCIRWPVAFVWLGDKAATIDRAVFLNYSSHRNIHEKYRTKLEWPACHAHDIPAVSISVASFPQIALNLIQTKEL